MADRISVAVVARDESGALRRLLPQILQNLKPFDATVRLMDDCSEDGTSEIAKEFGVQAVAFNQRVGLLQLLLASLRFSSQGGFDYHITMDGDGQHDPTYLPAIIQKLREGDDMVVNSRYHPRSPRQSAVPLDRELLNVQVTSAVERITEAGFTDPLCGLRGYNAKVVKFLLEQEFATRVCADTYGFVLESLLRVWHNGGFKIVELPHPAIYNGDGKIAEIYGEAHLEERLERFRMHAGHLVRTVRALNLPLKHVIS